MEKKVWIFALFTFIVILSFSSLYAQLNSTEEDDRVDAAYSCLQDMIDDMSCSSLSTQEKIFSVLAVNDCRSELISDSSNNECWSSSSSQSCDVKTTAQAVLALDNSGSSTSSAEDWLLEQSGTPTELQWFLEIEPDTTEGSVSCQISYSGFSSSVTVGEDKKLSDNAGACLVLAQDDYWLRVSPNCYDETFSISCDQSFLTTLLFRNSGSETVHVSPESTSVAPQGTSNEKVESSCFAQNGVCNYEGTLWATIVLNSLDYDVSSNLPYLITSSENNERFLPSSFLYMLTSDTQYRTELLSAQKSNKWWLESGDRLYDTALALYPFQDETITEKTSAKKWLIDEAQGQNGCWDNNIRNTGFILASVWPRVSSGGGGGGGLPSCEASGYFCTGTGSCQGDVLSEYSCPALSKCCTVAQPQVTCAESGGDICSSNEICRGGDGIGTADTTSGQVCCVGGGVCELRDATQLSACEQSAGICRSLGCNNGETQSDSLSCSFGGDVCCLSETKGSGGSLFWLWFFLILIVLAVVGIIFRDKLRQFWLRVKSKFGGSKGPSSPRPPYGRPPHSPGFLRRPPQRPPVQRNILLPPPIRPSPQIHGTKKPSRAQKELDDVLKKLKDMSK